MSHAVQGHSRWMGHRVLTNMVLWRREWLTTPVLLLQELHEQYEKTKRYDIERQAPVGWKVSNMLLGKSGGQLLIAPKE